MRKEIVGFVGAGNMGRPMIRRLLDRGFAVKVYDRDPTPAMELVQHGAEIVSSLAELGQNGGVICLSLPTPKVVVEVGEALAAIAKELMVVDLSTTGPKGSRQLAELLAQSGVELVDCPVSGGVAGAERGSLALMVGAPDAALQRVRPILESFGTIFHVGRQPGAGQTMKVVNNLMSAAALSISAESVVMAVKAGLNPATVVEVLNAGSGRNSATLDKFPRQVLTGTFDAGFAAGLMLKDVMLCIDQADAMGLEAPVARAVAKSWHAAVDTLGPQADFTRIVEVEERRADVVIRNDVDRS